MAQRYNEYRLKTKSKYREKLQSLQKSLPDYVNTYLNALLTDCQTSSAEGYAADILAFLQYLRRQNPEFARYETKDIPYALLGQLNYQDIQEYINGLSYPHRTPAGGTIRAEAGQARRMRMKSSLSGLFEYLTVNGYITKNPMTGVRKIHRKTDKAIDRLSVSQANRLVEDISNAETGTPRQQMFEKKTVLRDTAITKLLLGTGIRISECVGLDTDDIDFNENVLWVIRKGGKADKVYFNDDVAQALMDYMDLERPDYADEDNHALFLSLRRQRMTARSIQYMLKKFGTASLGRPNLSPHKLRKTFGTLLYDQSGDIKLVADSLGHASPETSAKYYIDKTKKEYNRDHNLYSEDN